jgi:hypothetical protein
MIIRNDSQKLQGILTACALDTEKPNHGNIKSFVDGKNWIILIVKFQLCVLESRSLGGMKTQILPQGAHPLLDLTAGLDQGNSEVTESFGNRIAGSFGTRIPRSCDFGFAE